MGRESSTDRWARKAARRVTRAASMFAVVSISAAVAGAAIGPLSGTLRERLVQILAVVLAASLPGWLFVRFMHSRIGAVWDEYVLNLHRLGMDHAPGLPPPLTNSVYFAKWQREVAEHHVKDLEEPTLYEMKFEAYYGRGVGKLLTDRARGAAAGRDQVRIGGLLPVVGATVVFGVGWAWIVGTGAFAAPLRGDVFDSLRFAFLGAYAFTLQVLLRRYFQNDLKASAYIAALVRVVTALVVVALLRVTPMTEGFSPSSHAAAAFVVGFFPSAVLRIVQQTAHRLFASLGAPSFRVLYPLGELDGLDFWYETRLLEEGIEDMENLATATLVEVLLQTRVPVARLVDWMDQAILYTHLLPTRDGGGAQRRRFRQLGLRTATDLLAVIHPDDGAEPRLTPEEAEALLGWAVFGDGWKGGVKLVAPFVHALQSDTNLVYVRNWHSDWSHACEGSGHRGEMAAQATAITGDGEPPAVEAADLVQDLVGAPATGGSRTSGGGRTRRG